MASNEARSHLTSEQREVCRRALGDEVFDRARAIGGWEFEFAPQPISLHEALCAHDVASGWLTRIFEQHVTELTRFLHRDFSDSRRVGRTLRKRATKLLEGAHERGELVGFLHEFSEDSTPGFYAGWGAAIVRLSALAVLQTATTDPNELLWVRREVARLESELHEWREAVELLLSEPIDLAVTAEDILDVAFGERPRQPVLDGHAIGRSFPGPEARFVELGFRQLRLVADTIFIPDPLADNYLGLAGKLASSRFPILAHRGAGLTGELISRAALAHTERTAALLAEFSSRQSGRIITAGIPFAELMCQVAPNPDTQLLPDAYRTLAEGIFRPFGSLLVRLEEVARGETPTYRSFATLGELSDALRAASTRIANLAALGSSRELRNFEAHEDIVRSEVGALMAVDADGRSHVIDVEDLLEKTLLLRSFLDGVDVAISVGFIGLSVLTQPFPRDYVRTEAGLQSVARIAAAQLSDGLVQRLVARGGEIEICFSGSATEDQLRLITLALRRQSSEIQRIRILGVGGQVLLDDRSS